MLTTRQSAARCYVALLLFGATASAQAGEIDLSTVFEVNDQSIWGALDGGDLYYYQSLARLKPNGSNPKRNFGVNATVAGVGVQFNGHIEVDHMFWAFGTMNGGTLNATLPYDISISYDDADLYDDNLLTFDSSFLLDSGASLTSSITAPDINLQNQWWYEVNGNFYGCYTFGCDHLYGFNKNHNTHGNPQTLLTLDADAVNSLPSSAYYDSLSINSGLSISGGVDGNGLTASGAGSIIDLDNLKPLKFVPVVGPATSGSFSTNFVGADIGVSWDLLSVEVDTDLKLRQELGLTPAAPDILLDFGNGYTTSFAAGTSTTIALPDWWSPEDGFTPSVMLNAVLDNMTALDLIFDADIKLPSINLHGVDCCDSLGTLSVVNNQTFSHEVFNSSFALDTLSYTGTHQSFTAPPSVPEPGVLLLLGSGLLGGFALRRNKLPSFLASSQADSLASRQA